MKECYLKSEADKVIEDIVKGAISMFRESSRCRGLDTKSPLGRIADVAFKHWNDVEYTQSNNRQLRLDNANLLRSNEYLRSELKTQITARQNDKIEYNLNIRRHKYKRCLAMAEMCEATALWCKAEADAAFLRYNWDSGRYTEVDFYEKWHKRWLEIAEKFKEAK